MTKFNHVYLILVHKYPNQLKRLIGSLSFKNCHFVIHVDERENIESFRKSVEDLKIKKYILFIPNRYRTAWGSFGLVEATLNGLKFIRTHLPKTHRVTLLSGQDYPIKPVTYIYDYLNANRSKIFIAYNKVTDIARGNQGIILRFPFFERISKRIELYKGSQWWSLPMSTIHIILEVIGNSKEFIQYFRLVKIPDESFFQTLLLNYDNETLRSNIVNSNLRFISWEQGLAHPKTVLSEDIISLLEHSGLFARKFDENVDSNILDLIDKKVLKET